MVEYGAGGQLIHPAEDTDAAAANLGGAGVDAADGDGGVEANVDGEPASTPAQAPTPTVVPRPPRRRRRAKGWYCPVCRQRKLLMSFCTTTPIVSLSLELHVGIQYHSTWMFLFI